MSFIQLDKLQLSFDGCENNMNIILQQFNATHNNIDLPMIIYRSE